LTELWRQKQLQYAWLRTLQGDYADFWQVTGDALDFAMASLGIQNDALRDRLMQLYLTLEPFPEVAGVLSALRSANFKTAILSNGSREMLAAVVKNAGIAQLLDHVLSVDEVRAYKTHPSVYRLAVERLGVPAHEIAFVSSNAWDAFAASAFGMRVLWCNRYGGQPEKLPGKPDVIISSLSEIPALIQT
jgi:2-haloacid dehalogenase